MENQYSRTELLIGSEGVKTLAQSSVLLFGVGGVGSFVAESLARAGIGRLILVDFDVVSLSNINRQIVALHSTIGEPKVEIMKKRILDINPGAEVIALKQLLNENTIEEFLRYQPDYIVDAIDMVSSKVLLIKECLQRNIPFISSMGAGNRLTAENYRVDDLSKTTGDPLAKVLRKLLREQGITRGVKVVFSPDPPLTPSAPQHDSEQDLNPISPPKEIIASQIQPVIQKRQVPGSISFVPSVAGLLLAGEVIRDLLKIQ